MGRTWISARSVRIVATIAVATALITPVVLDSDGFPLSTYPMYARTRSGESTIVTAQGVTEAGTRRTLTPTLIGASDDPLIVVGELRAALRIGRGADRCNEIAERVARRSDLDDVIGIQVVSERHATVERTLNRPSLLDRNIEAACDVPQR